MDHLVVPHGGGLQQLVLPATEAEALKQAAGDHLSYTLNQRQICDLELLMNGAFSPLTGFMNRASYEAVLADMRLPDGTLWPMPIVLDIPDALAARLAPGDRLALRDEEGFMPAVLEVETLWQPDRRAEALQVYGSDSPAHPGVRYLLEEVHGTYVGGRVLGAQLPSHFEFESLWDTPAELRHLLAKMGWRRVIAYQTSRPMHRLQRELTLAAAKSVQGHILIHPTVGMTKPGDLHHYARVHCYQAMLRHYPRNLALLSLLPLAMRMAGPREALWHAIVHQNYGCSHLVVGPHHASPPRADGAQFYTPYAAQELLAGHADDLAIQMVAVEEMRYSARHGRYRPLSQLQREGETGEDLSEAELRLRLYRDEPVPDWFSVPEVLRELRRVYPPRRRQGFTLFFTGLSGSGKSTLAKIIYAKLIEAGGRPVTLLDGDIVRQNLSSELGFSREHRNINVRRIGFVASEITKNGGVAICAPIAPYTATRRQVRAMIEAHGAFIEIHIATPLEVCEGRDRKGLYAKARKGLIPEFTGISDPYEEPERPELRIDTSQFSPMEAGQEIYLYLLREGFLDPDDRDRNGAGGA